MGTKTKPRWAKIDQNGRVRWIDTTWAGIGEVVIYKTRAAQHWGRYTWIRAHIVNGTPLTATQHSTLKAAKAIV